MSTATTIEPDVSETDLATTVRGARSKAQNAIDDVIAAVPSAAADGREVMDDLARRLEHAPDLDLVAVMSFSVGAGLGLLIGGAPRAMAIAGLLPAMAVGFALIDRRQAPR